MSPMNRIVLLGALILAGMLTLGGCGSSTANSQAPFNEATEQHPAGWLPSGHAQAAKADPASCIECHGSDLSGGISRVSCMTCHLNGSPFELTNCTSCHGNPPTGTVAPNRAAAHNTDTGHFAAQVKLPDGCNTCHSGAGTGTMNHDNGVVDVSLLNSYSAKSGTIAYNADGTCSNVSCHGGQTTPAWLTGTVDVNNQCLTCHAFGTTEYNSFFSGQHYFHVITRGWQGECWRCHDVTKLADVHFVSLNTTTLDGQAYLTVQSWANYDKNAGTCDAICHPGTRNW